MDHPTVHNMLKSKFRWNSGYVEAETGTVTLDLDLGSPCEIWGVDFGWWNVCAASQITVFASAAAEGDDFEQKATIDDAVDTAVPGKRNDHTVMLGWNGATRRIRIELGKVQTADRFYQEFAIQTLKITGRKLSGAATGGGGGGGGAGAGLRAAKALHRDLANRLSKQSIDAEIEAVAAADAADYNFVPSNSRVLVCATTFITELVDKHAMADTGKGGGGFLIEDEYNDDDGTMGEGGGEWPPPI